VVETLGFGNSDGSFPEKEALGSDEDETRGPVRGYAGKLRPGAGLQEKSRRDRSSSRVAGEEGESDLASWVIWPNLRGL